jgi:hypothetical protein
MIGDASICSGRLERHADFGTGGRGRFSRGSEFPRDGVNFRRRGARGFRLFATNRGPSQAKQKNKPGKPG